VVSFLSYVLERYIVSCVRAGLSRFDLQAKAQVDEREVTVEQFMQHQAAQVLTFPDADVQVRATSTPEL
jgi:hypothetical protein